VKPVTRRTVLCLLITALLPTVVSVDAQQSKKVSRIGFLSPFSASSDGTRKEAFLQGLRDLGYVDGKSFAIEYRSADGETDRLPVLAAELVRLDVDVIVTGSINAVRAAKKATSTIPIVFAAVGDAVESGLVASLANPGGNATGLTFFAPELDGKRLELLKESFPKMTRAAFLWTSGGARGDLIKAYEPVAKNMGLRLHSLQVKVLDDLERGFSAAKNTGIEALVVTSSPFTITHRLRIVDLANKHRLAGIYPWTDFVDAGGLMSYGPDIFDNFRRAATYVDKILKGAKPATLPVEQPKKFEFVVNLKAAKQIGLTIPPNVLVRADKVIR
jgi:putative ABC transport system substrate-binding protein